MKRLIIATTKNNESSDRETLQRRDNKQISEQWWEPPIHTKVEKNKQWEQGYKTAHQSRNEKQQIGEELNTIQPEQCSKMCNLSGDNDKMI